MHCPNMDTLNSMTLILTNERVPEVGAFIYSHLTNLKKTSDPHKQDAARTLSKLV